MHINVHVCVSVYWLINLTACAFDVFSCNVALEFPIKIVAKKKIFK